MSPQITTVHQSEGWICSALPGATSQAAGQSQSGSITITQQLCVFVWDYIFKKTLGGACGVRKVVWQTMKVFTQGCRKQRPSPPVTLLCGKIDPHNTRATWPAVLLSSSPVFPWSFSLSFPLSLTIFIPAMPRLRERSKLPGWNYTPEGKILTQNDRFGDYSRTVIHYSSNITFSSLQMCTKSPFYSVDPVSYCKKHFNHVVSIKSQIKHKLSSNVKYPYSQIVLVI